MLFNYLFLFTAFSSEIAAAPGDVSVFCIVRHCAGKALACQQNTECNKALGCSQSCPQDNVLNCSAMCQTRFGTSQFDDFSVCLINNQCIEPYPAKNFATPSTYSKLDLADFVGTWNVVAGLDKGLDCYANQSLTIAQDDQDASLYHHDISIEFPEGIRTTSTLMRQNSPGFYSVQYTLGGGGKDNWFVLGKSDTVAVVIYLGKNKLANYRGGYVLKKPNGELTLEEIEFVKSSLTDISGVSFNDFCRSLI